VTRKDSPEWIATNEYRSYLLGNTTFEAALNTALAAAENPDFMKERPWQVLGQMALIELSMPYYVQPVQGGRLSMDVLYTIDPYYAQRARLKEDMQNYQTLYDPTVINRPMELEVDDTPDVLPLVGIMRTARPIAVLDLIGLHAQFTPPEDQAGIL
jgi:hypothetical protein